VNGKAESKNWNLQCSEFVISRVDILRMTLVDFETQILIIATYIEDKNTFTKVIIHASQALESNAPDGFNSAVVTGQILMPNILVNLIGELKELRPLMVEDTFLTNIVIWLNFRFESFSLRFYGLLTIIAV